MSKVVGSSSRWIASVVIGLSLLATPCLAKERELRVPLDHGIFRTDSIAPDVQASLGFGQVSWLHGSIDCRGVEGVQLVKALNESLHDGCNITVADDESALVVRMDADKLPGSVDEAKLAVRTFTAIAAPDATAAQKRFYGLTLPSDTKLVTDGSKPLVVLVHGLDCNRSNWMPMADMLRQGGFQVAYFTYPSDQALTDSAKALADQMTALHDMLPDVKVDFITHSMGALVARAFVEGDQYPKVGNVEKLIMLAPPNHGSKWAAFRVALEIEEHYKLWRDESDWSPTWAITDGLGEAGHDLRVDSAFLTAMNARPRRSSIAYTTITGDVHPAVRLSAKCAQGVADSIPDKARNRWGFRQFVGMMNDVADDLRQKKSSNDGPVSINSAKLDGVKDFNVVDGDHSTIYIPSKEGEVPPAWAIVVDRLRK